MRDLKSVRDHWKSQDEWNKKHYILASIQDWYRMLKCYILNIGPVCIASWQRVTRGWADRDLWGFDIFLAQIISSGVARIREIKIGHPDGMTMKEHDEVLRQISDAFSLAEDISYHGRVLTKEETRRMKSGMKLFCEYFFSIWD